MSQLRVLFTKIWQSVLAKGLPLALSMDSLDLLPSKGHSVNYGIALNVNQVLTQNQFSDVFLIWGGV